MMTQTYQVKHAMIDTDDVLGTITVDDSGYIIEVSKELQRRGFSTWEEAMKDHLPIKGVIGRNKLYTLVPTGGVSKSDTYMTATGEIAKIDEVKDGDDAPKVTGPSPVQTLIDFVTAVGGTDIEATDSGGVNFSLGPAPALAYVKEGGSRIRGSVFIGTTEDFDEARRWVEAQPQPGSGVLEAVGMEEGAAETYLRILFERPLGHVPSSSDALFDDAIDYLEAWERGTDVAERGGGESFPVPGDPRDIEPVNAWLLKGTEPSFPSERTLLDEMARGQRGVFELLWTTAKQTEVGDLALVYFLSPRKAVHFVTRAASRAFYDSSIEVAAEGEVADEQWWAYFTPLIEIDPIPVKVLREHNGGYLPLRGRSGLFLRPDTIAGLQIRAKGPENQSELDRILVTPVGRANLPKPEEVTMEMWPHIASGAMPLEDNVSQHVVEPLLRFTLAGTSRTWRREYPVGRKWADYVVIDDRQPRCVIEVEAPQVLGRSYTGCGSRLRAA